MAPVSFPTLVRDSGVSLMVACKFRGFLADLGMQDIRRSKILRPGPFWAWRKGLRFYIGGFDPPKGPKSLICLSWAGNRRFLRVPQFPVGLEEAGGRLDPQNSAFSGPTFAK